MDSNFDADIHARRHHRARSSASGGIMLILLGLIFLAWTLGLFRFDLHALWPGLNLDALWPGINWGLVWPVFILLPGIIQLLRASTVQTPQERARLLEGGAVLVVLALFLFAAAASIIPWGNLWPLLLILGGGLILFRRGALSQSS